MAEVDYNILVCFGPTDEHYIVTCGRMLAYNNANEELMELLATSQEWNPLKLACIRCAFNACRSDQILMHLC